MRSSFLLPSPFKWFGGIMLLFGAALYIAASTYGFELSFLEMESSSGSISDLVNATDNYTISFALILLISGLIFLGFSRLKQEDEMIAFLRLQALQWSIYFCAAILILLTAFTFSLAYLGYLGWLWYLFLAIYCLLFYSKLFLLQLRSQNDEE
jgi:hypothetical protein